MNEAQLCSRCEELSISTLFYRPGPFAPQVPTQSLEYELGTLPEIWASTACALCRLIKQTLEAWYGHQHLENKLHESVLERVPLVLYCTPFDLNHDDTVLEADPVPCYLEIGFSASQGSWEYREDRLTNDEFDRSAHLAMLYSVEEPGCAEPKAHIGRVIRTDSIDWAHIKSWITFCSHHAHQGPHYGGSNPSKRVAHSRLRVIDVESACILPLPERAEYVALSYQWGMDQRLKLKIDNAPVLETIGFLNTADGQPSRTILDAIEAVKHLGYKYLWVDALCIIQDSAEDLQQNVDNMDQIYRNAELTIVGAAGKDADYGLPGISVSRTEQQMRTLVDGIMVANMLESAAGAVTFSRWNTRGWTYQERILSRRLLTFTTSQVFYHCHRNCDFQEQFHFRDDLKPLAPFDPRASLDLENRSIWETYAIAVGEYTKRFLSDPNDKLRAFSGLMKFLEGPLEAPFFFGLPVALFDIGLLWTFSEPCERGDSSYPTWSWAGWNGPVIYAYAGSMNNMCECTISQATISLPTPKVRLCSDIKTADDVSSRSYNSQHWQRHFDPDTLEILYTSGNPVYQGLTYPRPIVPFERSDHAKVTNEQAYILEISGQTAMFRLTDQHSQQRESLLRMKAKCRQGRHEMCDLAILDDQQRWAGTVVVDGRLLPKLRNRQHKFVALSRSTLYRIDLDPSWDTESTSFRHWTAQTSEHTEDDGADDEPNNDFFDREHFDAQVWWPAMNVLLLSEPKHGVVERMGIGRIHVDAFETIANQETILLG